MTEKKDIVETAIDKAKPIIANISFGGVMGYCSGVALHKIGKSIAVIIGLGFVGLQVAVSTGFIEVNWQKVKEGAKNKADINKDGALNTEDAKEYWRRLRKLLTNKIPGAGGFSLGFLYGVKSG